MKNLCHIRFRTAGVLLFGMAVILLSGATAGAGNTTKANPPILSASEIDYPPFCIVDEEGRAGGFSVELLRAALAAMGREVTFRTGPWGEVRGWLERGEVQALPLVGRTPEREPLFDFTFSYMNIHGAIVVREDEETIRDLSDLKGRRVAVMEGDNAEEFLRREDRGIEIHTTTTFEEALHALSEGHFDAVVIQRLVALRLIQETGLTNLRVIPRPIEGFRQDFCFAVREGDRETLALLNEGLALVMADGTYRHLHAMWFAALQLPSDRPIVIGGDHQYPPFEYLDEKGLPAGYNVDLTRAIAREMGLDIEIRLGPWAEIVQGMDEGKIDIMQGMFYLPERAAKFDFTQPHTVQHYIGLTRKGEGSPPTTIEELAGKRILVQRGDAAHDFLVERGLGDQVAVAETQEDVLRELSEGNHDCALAVRISSLYLIKERGWGNLNLGRKAFISLEYCYALPTGHKALLAQFSEGLKVVEASGEYRRIYEQWLGVYEERPIIDFLRYGAMIVIPLLLVLLAISLWSWSLRRQVSARTRELRDNLARLERSETLLNTTQHISRSGGWEWDVEHRQMFWTDGTYRIHDLDPDQIEPGSAEHVEQSAACYVEEDRTRVMAAFRACIENATPYNLDCRFSTVRGRKLWVRTSGQPVVVDGRVVRIIGDIWDITDRKRTEEALLAVSSRQQALLDAVPDIIMEVDSRKIYTWANQAGIDFFGDDVIGREVADYFVGEQKTYGTMQSLFDGNEQVIYVESRQRRKDGEERLLAWWCRVLKDSSGTVTGALSTARDITERKRAEDELRESEERYRTILESISDGYWEVDLEGRFTFFNDAMCRITRLSRKELMGVTASQGADPETSERMYTAFEKVYRTGTPLHLAAFESARADGTKAVYEMSATLMRDREGNPVGFRGITRDVTERTEMETALRESEEKYRTILESMEHGYWEVDLEGRYTFFNNAMSRLAGYAPEDLKGMSYRDYTSPLTQKRLSRIFRQVYETGKPAEIFDHAIIRKDSTPAISEMSVFLMKDREGNPIGFRGISRDITRRKEMEEQIRQSEERYRMIVERMSDIVWMTDMDLRTTFVTPSIETVLGFTPEERMLQPIDEQLTPDSLSYALNLLAEELDAEQAGGVDPHRTRTLELEYYHKNGSTRWMETVISGMRDDQGTLTGLLGVFRDITDRKQAEQELHETLERLKQSVAATIQVMISAVEIRDPYTAGHQNRVADLAGAVAAEMGFEKTQIEGMRVAGLIHDIGKLSVPAEILSKPTTLTPIEFSLIKDHARSGYEILKNVETDWPLAEIVHQHHERLDGSGYPRGLKGDDILIEARILAVADVVEAMASHRPWRPAFDIEAVLAEIEGNRGTLYDDKTVDACLTLFRKKGYRLP